MRLSEYSPKKVMPANPQFKPMFTLSAKGFIDLTTPIEAPEAAPMQDEAKVAVATNNGASGSTDSLNLVEDELAIEEGTLSAGAGPGTDPPISIVVERDMTTELVVDVTANGQVCIDSRIDRLSSKSLKSVSNYLRVLPVSVIQVVVISKRKHAPNVE